MLLCVMFLAFTEATFQEPALFMLWTTSVLILITNSKNIVKSLVYLEVMMLTLLTHIVIMSMSQTNMVMIMMFVILMVIEAILGLTMMVNASRQTSIETKNY